MIVTLDEEIESLQYLKGIVNVGLVYDMAFRDSNYGRKHSQTSGFHDKKYVSALGGPGKRCT